MKLLFSFLIVIIALPSCSVEWTDHEKEKIMKDCKMAALRYGFTDADKHCDCVLRNIINRYPNPNQFENMEMGEFGEIVAECQGRELSTRIIWPDNTKKAFVDSCISLARFQNKQQPEVYCNCILDEIIHRYPTDDSVAGFKQSEILQIGAGCEVK